MKMLSKWNCEEMLHWYYFIVMKCSDWLSNCKHSARLTGGSNWDGNAVNNNKWDLTQYRWKLNSEFNSMHWTEHQNDSFTHYCYIIITTLSIFSPVLCHQKFEFLINHKRWSDLHLSYNYKQSSLIMLHFMTFFIFEWSKACKPTNSVVKKNTLQLPAPFSLMVKSFYRIHLKIFLKTWPLTLRSTEFKLILNF